MKLPNDFIGMESPYGDDWKQAERRELRDRFAMAALTGLLASGIAAERGQTHADVAEIAYANADAMLAARDRETGVI